MSLRRSLSSLLTLLCALAGAFLLVGPAEAAAPPPPPVGACYSYGWATYNSMTAPQAPVSCSGWHTAKTVGVGTMLAGATLDNFVQEPNLSHMTRTCYTALKKALNTTWVMYEQTGYQSSVYRPTQAQWDAGARWFRCDAVLQGTGRIFAHPRSTVALVSPLTNRERACMDKYFEVVSCTEVHIYRSVAGFGISASTFPSREQWRNFALKGCPRLVSTDNDFGYSVPWRSEFAVGDRAIACYNKSTG